MELRTVGDSAVVTLLLVLAAMTTRAPMVAAESTSALDLGDKRVATLAPMSAAEFTSTPDLADMRGTEGMRGSGGSGRPAEKTWS
jgi:hypothetical protein